MEEYQNTSQDYTKGVSSLIWPFARVESMLCNSCNLFNFNCSLWWPSSSLTVFHELVCVETKLTEMHEDVALKNFSQCHSTFEFWRQVTESKHSELKAPVYDSFLYLAQLISVYCRSFLFSVMKLIKSEHRVTLAKQHLWVEFIWRKLRI